MDKRNVLKDSFLDFMHALYDLTILNWLWLLCSLPIVTIGPATAAVYAVTLKMARDEESGIVKPFFKAFREGFPQALILSLLVGVLLVVRREMPGSPRDRKECCTHCISRWRWFLR